MNIHSGLRRIAAVSFVVISASSCVTTLEELEPTIEIEEPRASTGVVIEGQRPEQVERWLDEIVEGEREAARRRAAGTAGPAAGAPPRPAPARPPSAAKRAGARQTPWPAGTGRIADLPAMGAAELSEILEVAARRLRTELGYADAAPDVAQRVPFLPDDVHEDRVLARETPEGIRVLRLGYWRNRAHLPQLVYHGAVLAAGSLLENADLDAVGLAFQGAVESLDTMRRGVTFQDLDSRIIRLSYVDVPGALTALSSFGLSTFPVQGGRDKIPETVAFETLPWVVELPSPASDARGLVGSTAQLGQGQFGSTVVPAIASSLAADVVASPTSRLLVLFHPSRPDQFSRVKKLLDEVIDRPARQIFVEAMVLEISSAGLADLGVEWEFQKGKWDVTLGSLNPLRLAVQTLGVSGTKLEDDGTRRDLPTDWGVRIRSLIVDGKARILSRPSVLTLDDRQATIRIGRDFPIATSQEGIQSDSSKISFDFKYLQLGIMLNIRPRISEDGNEISIMVDTMVSSRVPEGDLEIRDDDGTLRASAPQVDTRRVQTYACIQNNTPFIIGGLVSTNKTVVDQKVPVLGDIPFLGALFRKREIDDRRSEVIIVLTPYVIPDEIFLSRALPKDGLMDESGSELFRDSYRISREDVVDFSFIYRNRRFQAYHELANRAVREDFRLAEVEPFRSFADGRLPAEEIPVHRILYEVLERLGLEERIDQEHVFVLARRADTGYERRILGELLDDLQVGDDLESFLSDSSDQALAISFRDPIEATGHASLIGDPVPDVRIVECPDRDAWSRLLWDLNQPWPDGSTRHTILLHRQEDVERLRRSMLLKYVLEINGASRNVSLFDYIPGRIFEAPKPSALQWHLIDAEVAKYFFHSEHFYRLTIQRIENALRALDEALRRPEFRGLLQGAELPPPEEK
jgi:general secretion pathway protein D